MRGQQDSLTFSVQLTENIPQGKATLRVKAGRGLIEKEDRRVM
jgi:hypothetical protein